MKQLLHAKLTVLLAILLSSFALSSCGGDDDEPDDMTYYDFSIEWEVVDKGAYSVADAKTIAANFTSDCEYCFQKCTEVQAITKFDDFCQKLRYEFATNYKEITLLAKLIRVEGEKEISHKTFYIHPDGTTIK